MTNETFEEFFVNKGFSTCHWEGGLIECDKGTAHNYINSFYGSEFTSKKNENITLVEIGVCKGVSLKLWTDWFENATIIGIDRDKEQCYEWGLGVLDDIYNFDIIWKDGYLTPTVELFEDNSIDYLIDDGPHDIDTQLFVVNNWLPKVRVGGKLIIEDIKSLEYVERMTNVIAGNPNFKYDLFDNRLTHSSHDDLLLVISKL